MVEFVNKYAEAFVSFNSAMDIDEIRPYGDTIADALSRQIPIKPYYRKEEDAEGWACPNCDMGVEHDHGRIKDIYCHSCGQMLDWDNIDEKEPEIMKWNKVRNDELPNDFEEVLVAHCTEDGEYLYPLCHMCEYRCDEHEWVDSDTGEERLVDSSDCWIRITLPGNVRL